MPISLRKIVTPEPPSHKLSHEDRVFLLGSCFADSLREYLEAELVPVVPTPYGVMYNPLSMAEGLRRLLDGEAPREDELRLVSGLWTSTMHHGDFSRVDKREALTVMREAYENARLSLQETRLFVFTFGTAYLYEDKATGCVVSNCHRRPANDFLRRKMTTTEAVKVWIPLLDRLLEVAPLTQILFSVSPIPHYRDGVHENSVSKATLHLLVDELIEGTAMPERVRYFPAYEIMRDELRDYRFYGDDFAHPTPLAVQITMERFAECYFSQWQHAKEWHDLRNLLHHRPLTRDPDRLKAHYLLLREKITAFHKKYPHPTLEKALTEIQDQYDTI